MKYIKLFEKLRLKPDDYIAFTHDIVIEDTDIIVIRANRPYQIVRVDGHTPYEQPIIICDDGRYSSIHPDSPNIKRVSKKDAQIFFDAEKYNL
jgi:hypothetical protein